jgi:hypothetical protein
MENTFTEADYGTYTSTINPNLKFTIDETTTGNDENTWMNSGMKTVNIAPDGMIKLPQALDKGGFNSKNYLLPKIKVSTIWTFTPETPEDTGIVGREINLSTYGGRRHKGSKKARKGNKMLSSWVAFVKKVQHEEKISYSDAMKRASARKKEWKMGQMGGQSMPKTDDMSMLKTDDMSMPKTDMSMADDEDMYGGRRRRGTKRRGTKRRGTKKRRGSRRY